jgi:hypothetical protein
MDNFDISEFAKMFDAALASDNPAVQKALRNFMMVAAIVHAQENNDNERVMGPIETLIKRVETVERMIRDLNSYDRYTRPAKEDYYSKLYGQNPTWVYQLPTTSSSSSADTFNSITSMEIADILKDIKFDE